MEIEVMTNMAIFFFSFFLVFLAVSIYFYILYDVPQLYKELSGKSVKNIMASMKHSTFYPMKKQRKQKMLKYDQTVLLDKYKRKR